VRQDTTRQQQQDRWIHPANNQASNLAAHAVEGYMPVNVLLIMTVVLKAVGSNPPDMGKSG